MMVTISDKQICNNKIIDQIVDLHISAFPEFFLTQLGDGFLKALYQGYFDDEYSGIIVAEYDDEIVGFIAYSYDYPNFFKELIKKKLINFAFYSFIALLKHPSFAKKLISAFGKSESVEKGESYVQLASICVAPDKEHHGIGTEMINYLKGAVDFDKYSFICLETDANNNDGVNKFYRKNGFTLSRQFMNSGNRLMNEYRFSK